MGARLPEATRTALRALAHPTSLTAIAVLLVNDHLLKAHFPGLVTGKLSDIAGLIFFPIMVVALVGYVLPRPNQAMRMSAAVVAMWFAAMKTLPPVAMWTESIAEIFIGRSQIVVDPWDLVALPAIGVAARIYGTAVARPREDRLSRTSIGVRRQFELGVLGVAALASMATSCEEDPGLTDITVDESGQFVGAGPGYGQGVQRATQACLPDGLCFRIDGGAYVLESRDAQHWNIAWAFPPGRLEFVNRYADGCDPYEVRSWDIAITAEPDPRVLVAMGHDGLLQRSPDGTWERDITNVALPLAEYGVNVWGELVVAASIALLLALAAVLMAKRQLAPAGELRVSGWTGTRLVILGATAIVALSLSTEGQDVLALLAVGAALPVLLGLSGVSSLWARLSQVHPRTTRRLGLVSTALVAIAAVGFVAPFLAWSAGSIAHWSTAVSIAMPIAVVPAIVMAAYIMSGRGQVDESPAPESDRVQTEPDQPDEARPEIATPSDVSGADLPWLAALVLWLSTSMAGAYPATAIVFMFVATYLAARWTGHANPANRMFIAVAAGIVGWAGWAFVGPAAAAWGMTAFAVKPPSRTAWIPRLALLPIGGLVGWVTHGHLLDQVVLTSSTNLPPSITLPALIPFAMVATDRLTEWWVRDRAASEPEPPEPAAE